MAKKGHTAGEVEAGFQEAVDQNTDSKFKSYKNEGFVEFEANEQIDGTLISIRDHSMMDKRKKTLKEVRVYNIRRTGSDELLRLAGRTMLDRMADDVMDEHGGFNVVNRRYSGPGYEWFIGREVKFIRGSDTKTNDGNQLGTYEILVAED